MGIVLKQKKDRAPGFTGVAGFNLDDLAGQAIDEVRQSQVVAKSTIEKARQQSDAIQAQARDQGREQGLKDADEIIDRRVSEAFEKALVERMATLEQSVEQLWTQESQWLQQWKDTTLTMALEIARQITRNAIEQNPEIVLSWAAEAIEAVRGARRIVLAVHPETLSLLGTQLDKLARQPGLPENTRIEPDESVEPMGIVARQEGGEVDLQLETQIAQLQRQLSE